MPKIEPDEQDDAPLDPVMEKVRRKMVRLMIVSAGVMFVSLMAVLTAVVYKVTKTDGKEASAAMPSVPSDQPIRATVTLPMGFEVQNTSLSENRILFFGRDANRQTRLVVFDIGVGRIVADIAVASH